MKSSEKVVKKRGFFNKITKLCSFMYIFHTLKKLIIVVF